MEVKELKSSLKKYADQLGEKELTELLAHAQKLIVKKENLSDELNTMSSSELSHLEEEFSDYKKKHPIE